MEAAYLKPEMEWSPNWRQRSGADHLVRIILAKAPLDAVLPQCVGAVRATLGGAILQRGSANHPYLQQKQIMGEAGLHDAYSDFTLVSTPEGVEEITIIEFSTLSLADLELSLSKLAPEIETIFIDSLIEAKSRQWHRLSIRRGGQIIRKVSVVVGWDSKDWVWSEEGDRLPWEHKEAYERPNPKDRLNRKKLFDYAKAWGVDPDRHLFERHLSSPTLIEAGRLNPLADPNDIRLRTTEFEGAYLHALSLGVGSREPADGGKNWRDEARITEEIVDWQNRMVGALERAAKKSDLTVEKLWKLVKKWHQKLPDFYDYPPDPSNLFSHASQIARRIDPKHDVTKWLASWSRLNTQAFDLHRQYTELLTDEQFDKLPGFHSRFSPIHLSAYDVLETGVTLEAAFKRRFFAMTVNANLKFDADAPLLKAASELRPTNTLRVHLVDLSIFSDDDLE